MTSSTVFTVETLMLLAGAALGALFMAFAESRSGATRPRLYGGGLIVASALYIVFAVTGGATDWVATEVGGTLVFTAVAVGGVRRAPYILALGWAIHAGWDLLLHTGLDNAFVPVWYVPLCVGFDLMVAGGLLKSALPSGD